MISTTQSDASDSVRKLDLKKANYLNITTSIWMRRFDIYNTYFVNYVYKKVYVSSVHLQISNQLELTSTKGAF